MHYVSIFFKKVNKQWLLFRAFRGITHFAGMFEKRFANLKKYEENRGNCRILVYVTRPCVCSRQFGGKPQILGKL